MGQREWTTLTGGLNVTFDSGYLHEHPHTKPPEVFFDYPVKGFTLAEWKEISSKFPAWHEDFSKVVNPGKFKIPIRNFVNPEMSDYRAYNVFVRIEYKSGKLSITGVEGPLANGNAKGSCGQIYPLTIDLINREWIEGKIRGLDEIWKRYHLNDLTPGCEHQESFGWKYDTHKDSQCPICGYKIGTAWKFEEVPTWALDFLKALPESQVTPAWV